MKHCFFSLLWTIVRKYLTLLQRKDEKIAIKKWHNYQQWYVISGKQALNSIHRTLTHVSHYTVGMAIVIVFLYVCHSVYSCPIMRWKYTRSQTKENKVQLCKIFLWTFSQNEYYTLILVHYSIIASISSDLHTTQNIKVIYCLHILWQVN